MGKRPGIRSLSQERKEFLGGEMGYYKYNRRVKEKEISERL